jgi:uncharacterized protein YegL
VTGAWRVQISTDVARPENWDFSIERTDNYEMGTQLDPWRWGHVGDTPDPAKYIGPNGIYVDKLYGDLCIHFLNGCEQLAMYDFKLELVFWNWPEGGEGCEYGEGIGCNGDLMLILDSSGSIEPANRTIAADAAKGFVDILMLDNARIGVTNFSDNGLVEQVLTNDSDLLNASIDAVYTGWVSTWMTNLYEGINVSRIELKSVRDRPDAEYQDYMIIITDGLPNLPTDGPTARAMALAEATAAKAEGTIIYVIGVDGVDPTYCKSIASSADSHYFAADDWTDLADILANLINCPQIPP